MHKTYQHKNTFSNVGAWISRTILNRWRAGGMNMKAKGGEERGKDYNHSTFVDLVINGLLGEMCVLVVVVLCCVGGYCVFVHV
jgi:hypothetical protein